MLKRQLPIEADLIINHLRREAIVERQRAVFEIDDDVPQVPSYDPLANQQIQRTPVYVS